MTIGPMTKTASVALLGIILLSACQGTQDRAKRNSDMQRDITIAQANFNNIHKDQCIASFKNSMHDPSSFELAGELTLNRIWINTSYGIDWDYMPPRRVVYTARIRGKNKFGGLVLNEMRCIFGVTDSSIFFAGSAGR